MGIRETRWQHSPSRRRALGSLAALVGGSPLLARQLDPRPLWEHPRIKGLEEMVESFDFEPVFYGNVTRSVYDYTAYGVESEFTLRRNREVFDWVDIVNRAPVSPSSVNTERDLFGLKLAFPMYVAPTATQVPLHPDGEGGMRRGATAARTPMVLSANSSVPLDKVAAAAEGPIWYQFYPRQDLNETRTIMERAQSLGYQAVVITVDQQSTYYERTLRNRNLGGNPRVPGGGRRGGGPGGGANPSPYRIGQGRLWYEWKYLDQIRPFIKGPMLVKGIVTAEDAVLSIEHGADGVVVSNHGGRSTDYEPSTLEVLPEIVDAVRGRIPVLIDGGFRRGSDIFKALALGAQAVLLGRTTRWGLGAFGAPGVQKVLQLLQAELVATMAAAGRPTLASIDRTAVRTHFS